jgi:hypothetical protein
MTMELPKKYVCHFWWKTSGWYPIWMMQYHCPPKAKYNKAFNYWWWSKEVYGLFSFLIFVWFLACYECNGFLLTTVFIVFMYILEWIFYGMLLLCGGFCWVSIKGMNALLWELLSFCRGYAKFCCAMCLLGEV